MHCPHCGIESAVGLRYCKRCGGYISPQAQDSASIVAPPKITGAAFAVALATIIICLGGLGIVITHAYDLVRPLYPGMERPLTDPTLVAITILVFGAATVFGVIALLIRLFTRMMGIPEPPRETAKSISPFQKKVSPQPQAQLPASPMSAPSVTEHTTRTFDPVYHDPGARE